MKNTKIVFDKYGGSDVLKTLKEEISSPSHNKVLIQVLATGVAHGDIMIRKGILVSPFQKFPVTPGFEVVGIVKEVGENVTSMHKNQLVASLTITGGYSEYICIDQKEIVILPDEINVDAATSIILNYTTAYQMLHRYAKVQKGNNILVHGACGGVGIALLQLGKLFNLNIIGTASPKNHQLITKSKAIPMDYNDKNLKSRIKEYFPEGLHAIFDPLGGESFKDSYKLLAKNGCLVGYGFQKENSKGFVLKSLLRLIIYKFIPDNKYSQFYSIAITRKTKPTWLKEDLESLFNLLKNGDLQPIIQESFPLLQATKAHELFEKRETVGKILLT